MAETKLSFIQSSYVILVVIEFGFGSVVEFDSRCFSVCWFVFQDMLNLTYSAVISGNSWKGIAVIPWEYLPQNVEKFNAYAIHGSGKDRVYESLFPVPHGEFKDPDL